MINLGEVQELKISKIIKAGALLKDEDANEVLLPHEEIENE